MTKNRHTGTQEMGGGGAKTLQLMNNCSEAVIDNYIPGEYQHSVYIRNGTSIYHG